MNRPDNLPCLDAPDPSAPSIPSLRRSPGRGPRRVLTAMLLAAAWATHVTGAEGRLSPMAGPFPDPTPYVIPERLAIPVLPASPSPAQIGEYAYYYHCMPCHGDAGQGLTEEWRQVWVDDHQNCWARGCHAGRPGDEGFPIPRQVPAVIRSSGGLTRFLQWVDLEVYLRATHPPQRPGTLSDEEVQGLTAYLMEANGRPPDDPSPEGRPCLPPAAVTGFILTLVLLGAWLGSRQRLAPG